MKQNRYPYLIPTDGKDDLIAQAQSLMQEVADESAAATKASQGADNELGPILMIYEDKDVRFTWRAMGRPLQIFWSKWLSYKRNPLDNGFRS